MKLGTRAVALKEAWSEEESDDSIVWPVCRFVRSRLQRAAGAAARGNADTEGRPWSLTGAWNVRFAQSKKRMSEKESRAIAFFQ